MIGSGVETRTGSSGVAFGVRDGRCLMVEDVVGIVGMPAGDAKVSVAFGVFEEHLELSSIVVVETILPEPVLPGYALFKIAVVDDAVGKPAFEEGSLDFSGFACGDELHPLLTVEAASPNQPLF